jgi:hypothetical protein
VLRAVFDAVVNNADGKIRHRCRCPTGGCSAAIMVCLGEEYKLRIVLWQWRGRRLPGRALQALARVARGAGLGRSGGRTSRAAVPGQGAGTSDRTGLLIQHRVHSYLPEDWPAVPWPPV